MSEQFFYPEFQLVSKKGVATLPVSEAQQVVLEVPRKLIEDWKRENPEQKGSGAKFKLTPDLTGE